MRKGRGLDRFIDIITGRSRGRDDSRSDLGAVVVREAEQAVVDRPAGATAPNIYVVTLDLETAGADDDLRWKLTDLIGDAAIEHGWRLDGPVEVTLVQGGKPGRVEVDSAFETGELPVWAVLSAVQSDARYELRYNRTLVGRAKENDIVITDPSISRRHALLWREVGRCWIADFSSSNGTFVNGDPVFEVFEVKNSDLILFGEAAFDLEIT